MHSFLCYEWAENGFGCETVLSSKVNDIEISLESDDGNGSPVCSLPSSQNIHSNSIMSVPLPSKAHIDEEKDKSKSAISSAICDNRSAYSTLVSFFFLFCLVV